MEKKNQIQTWFDSTNWKKRPNAICKPCWELKYCPYGPLVEDFPVGIPLEDDKVCRIFGHECPVFTVAEPFTETKDLRNISRDIPRPVQFRVLKRDNQICSVCNQNVKDSDIEFDHIIPYSKGGHSDESNIRLLCSSCNRKRSNNFEDEFLVKHFAYHTNKHDDTNSLDFLIIAAAFIQDFIFEHDRVPSPQEMADVLAEGDLSPAEEIAISEFERLREFMENKKPKDLTDLQFECLKLRWGFQDSNVYKIKEVIKLTSIDENEFYKAEKNLLERLGYFFKDTSKIKKTWLKS